MSLRSLAGSLSFSHLKGLGRTAKKADEDDANAKADEKEECDDDEEMIAEDAAADDDGDGTANSKKAKSKKKDKGDDDESDQSDDDENDDDDEDAKKGEKKAAAKARKAERARCGAIFASSAAAGNIELAAKLAFTTDLSAGAAKAILEATPARARGLGERMTQAPQTRVQSSAGPTPSSDAKSQAMWAEAFKPYQPAK